MYCVLFPLYLFVFFLKCTIIEATNKLTMKPKIKSAASIRKASRNRYDKKMESRATKKPAGTASGRVKTLKAKAENKRANRASVAMAKSIADKKAMAKKASTKKTVANTPKKTVMDKARADVKKPSVRKQLMKVQEAMKGVKKSKKTTMTPKKALNLLNIFKPKKKVITIAKK